MTEARNLIDQRRESGKKKPSDYPTDPVGYCRDILKVEPWAAQREIMLSLRKPPFRTMVKSGHGTGKTFVAACCVNWFFDNFDPGASITTAPTKRDVCDLLWKEVRVQRQRAGLPLSFIGPSAPEMSTSVDHYAKGFTARQGESFQGRHDQRMLFVFDEAVGVPPMYWETLKTMFQPKHGHACLVIGNPTDTTSAMRAEERLIDEHGNPCWNVISLSSLDHPNIQAELAGEEQPIPGAVSLSQVQEWVNSWCEPIPADEAKVTDIQWPPDSTNWFRVGPLFEARALGRWPSSGTYGVWSDALWGAVEKLLLPINWNLIPEIGADVAYFGDDFTAFVVRIGACALHHECHNGWDHVKVAGRLMQLAREYADLANAHRDKNAKPMRGEEVRIKVDDDGVGGGVVSILRAAGFTVLGVGAGTRATAQRDYPNKRSELWFQIALQAWHSGISLARLSQKSLRLLASQATAPTWEPDAAGRRVVESKDETKVKIGRSPDDMDALNLAFYEGLNWAAPKALPNPKRSMRPEGQESRKVFGRKW